MMEGRNDNAGANADGWVNNNNIEKRSEDPRFDFQMKRWVYDEQQDVTRTAGDESEADVEEMNSFIYSIQCSKMRMLMNHVAGSK
jgi:hypothetical protein